MSVVWELLCQVLISRERTSQWWQLCYVIGYRDFRSSLPWKIHRKVKSTRCDYSFVASFPSADGKCMANKHQHMCPTSHSSQSHRSVPRSDASHPCWSSSNKIKPLKSLHPGLVVWYRPSKIEELHASYAIFFWNALNTQRKKYSIACKNLLSCIAFLGSSGECHPLVDFVQTGEGYNLTKDSWSTTPREEILFFIKIQERGENHSGTVQQHRKNEVHQSRKSWGTSVYTTLLLQI